MATELARKLIGAVGAESAAAVLRILSVDEASRPSETWGYFGDELEALASTIEQGLVPAPEPEPVAAPCPEGFHWIGQSFATCDACGLPAWEHAGMATVVAGTPFSREPLALVPWAEGEADLIRGKWAPLSRRTRSRSALGIQEGDTE